MYRRNKKEQGRVGIGVASVERLFYKPERRALLARIQGTGFVLVNQLYVNQNFTTGGTWTWNVYILPCSYASDRTNRGRIRHENMQHPLCTLSD